ncbi:calcium/sodium antiporter [Candidatus Saccharibacteria bacterium]|nr:calcium/sodium antiporter [Candidatus Saccharibacteria bacterium]
MLVLQIILLVVGFALLIKGADIFVDGASSTAQNFKVPKILIGLTIVAFGTSAPELAVSIKALASGSSDMVLGNVIGSNILNIFLILGLAAVIRPVVVRRQTVIKEIPFYILLTGLLVNLILDSTLNGASDDYFSRADGITTIMFFIFFVYYLVKTAIRGRAEDVEERPKYKLAKSLLFVGLGLAGIILGSHLVVESATEIAHTFGVSERIISLTVIAFGTSLPELVTSVMAAKKGEQELLIGNIIGSNIFNIAVVLGVPAVMFGGVDVTGFSAIDIFTFAISAIVLFAFAFQKRKISRIEGVMMLAFFVSYYGTVFIE